MGILKTNSTSIDVADLATALYRHFSIRVLSDIEQGDLSPRIIVHSMMKTSTTSMGKALILLGQGKYDHGWRPDLGNKYRVTFDAANCLVRDAKSIHEVSDHNKLAIKIMFRDLVSDLKECSIFSDFPIGHIRINPFIKKIVFPKAKFIWIDRDMEGWLKSVKKWQLSHPDVFRTAETVWRDETKAKENLMRSYNMERSRLVNLKKDFPEDVLLTRLSSGWGDLCAFLNCEVPAVEFPHENRSDASG